MTPASGSPSTPTSGRPRGIFFDEDDARRVAARLVGDGYDATVERERLAGEDDDEDHHWAVLTDAPEPLLDLLVDTYDGWLDHDGPAGAPTPGRADGPVVPPLPVAPKRLHRP